MDYETNYEDAGDGREIVCDICGSNQFTSQEGFYYCGLCHTQSQQTREYIDESATTQQVERAMSAGVAVLGKKTQSKKARVQRTPKTLLTSWEVYNVLLKAVAEKLISIGFQALLKAKVFELWKKYLGKRKVILHENDRVNSSSRITLGEPRANLATFYKYKKQLKKRYAARNRNTSTTDSYLARKRAGNKLRRTAFETTYLASQEDDDLPPGLKRAKKERVRRIRLTRSATTLYTVKKTRRRKPRSKGRFLEQFDKSRWAKRLLQSESFSYSKVLILLFVASRQIGCRVVLTDFIRLFDEGTLYVNSLHSLLGLEAGSRHSAKANVFLQTNSLGTNNPVSLASTTEAFLDYLGVRDFQYPKFQEFLPKFVEDSSLPLEFESLLLHLYKMYPEEDHLLDLGLEYSTLKLLVELLITSMIGLLLRMLFGLDDVTEKHQSLFASKVNEILTRHFNSEENQDPRAEWTQLFDIKEWFRHIRYRRSFLEQERLTPILFRHGKPPNLIRLNDITTRYSMPGTAPPNATEIKVEPETDWEDAQPPPVEEMVPEARNRNAIAGLKGMFQLAASKEHGLVIPEVSDYISLPYPYQTIVEEFKRGKPNVAYPKYDSSVLYGDFGKKRIDFIFNPEKYIPLLEKGGYKVTVLPGTASQYNRELKVKRRRLLLFQPYKKLEDFPEGHAPIPASMQFVLDHLSRYIYDGDNHEEGVGRKPHLKVQGLIEKLTQLFTLRSLNGFVPLLS